MSKVNWELGVRMLFYFLINSLFPHKKKKKKPILNLDLFVKATCQTVGILSINSLFFFPWLATAKWWLWMFVRQHSETYLYKACVHRLSSLSQNMISWVRKLTSKLDPEDLTCLFAYSGSRYDVKSCPISGTFSHLVCSGW